MPVSWEGFKPYVWDQAKIRAENEAWKLKHGPALKKADEEKAARRKLAEGVFASLTNEQQAALRPYTSLGMALK